MNTYGLTARAQARRKFLRNTMGTMTMLTGNNATFADITPENLSPNQPGPRSPDKLLSDL
jgi:hypothetical protein